MKRMKGASKSRLGCQKCKDRRIKCDESRPECGPCLRSGFSCPASGSHTLRWSRKHEIDLDRTTGRSGRLDGPSLTGNARLAQNTIGSVGWQDEANRITRPFQRDHSMNSLCWLPDTPQPNEFGAEVAYQDASALLFADFVDATEPSILSLSRFENPFEFSMSPAARRVGDSFVLPSPPGSSEGPNTEVERGGHTGKDVQGQISRDPVEQKPGSSKNLLHTFYRLSSPPRSTRQISGDKLVAYYFKHVSRLHSCFESERNIFCCLTTKYLESSRTLSLILQSMAIAHLTIWYPYMSSTGFSKRHQAWRSLQKDLEQFKTGQHELNQILLCLFLISISSSWLHDNHPGLQYLHITRTLIQSRLRSGTLDMETEGLGDFWASGLVYWEMLACLIDSVPVATLEEADIPDLNFSTPNFPITPHPWTSLVPELMFAFAEICRVSRRYWDTTTCTDSEHLSPTDREWLRRLEQFLLSITIPSEEQILDIDDPLTSKIDLIKMANVYKCTGLLEIYRLHPALLLDRLDNDLDALPFETIVSDSSNLATEVESYLTSFACQVFDIADTLYLSSGACKLQPLIFLCISNHFLLSKKVEDDESEGDDNITQYRYRLEARLLGLSRRLPQLPILKVIEATREIWKRNDGDSKSQWISVMHDFGWQTMLG